MVEPAGVIIFAVGVVIGVVVTVCVYNAIHPKVPRDDPKLREEIKAIDEQIKLAEDMKQRGEVTAANGIFLNCAILLGKLQPKVPTTTAEYKAVILLIDGHIRRLLQEQVSVIFNDLP